MKYIASLHIGCENCRWKKDQKKNPKKQTLHKTLNISACPQFAEINSKGDFPREEVLTALVQREGDVDEAVDQLNNSVLSTFSDRIWNPEENSGNIVEGDLSKCVLFNLESKKWIEVLNHNCLYLRYIMLLNRHCLCYILNTFYSTVTALDWK